MSEAEQKSAEESALEAQPDAEAEPGEETEELKPLPRPTSLFQWPFYIIRRLYRWTYPVGMLHDQRERKWLLGNSQVAIQT